METNLLFKKHSMTGKDACKPCLDTAALPESIRHSHILSPANIHQLAGVPEIPDIDPAYYDSRLQTIFQYYSLNPAEMETELHLYARELLETGRMKEAWQVLLSMI